MSNHVPVSVVIPLKSPVRRHLSRTLFSLAELDPAPTEVVLVDSTPGGFQVGENNGSGNDQGCGLCAPVAIGLEILRERAIGVDVIQDESLGLGAARRAGLQRASQPFVTHMDEDSVLLSRNWFAVALDRLDTDGVTGVGGAVTRPIEDTVEGRVLARLGDTLSIPLEGHNITHPKHFCDGDQCFFAGQHRGEDITLRRHLKSHGTVVRVQQLECLKDLPTKRQSMARNIAGSVATGAVAAIGTQALRSALGV